MCISLNFNSENDLPQNRTGLRIWKKINHGEFTVSASSYRLTEHHKLQHLHHCMKMKLVSHDCLS